MQVFCDPFADLSPFWVFTEYKADIIRMSPLFIVIVLSFVMKTLHFITWILIIIGALNWLLVGIFGWDVGMLFGGQSAVVSRIIYVLVGLSAVFEIFTYKGMGGKM